MTANDTAGSQAQTNGAWSAVHASRPSTKNVTVAPSIGGSTVASRRVVLLKIVSGCGDLISSFGC